MVFEVEFSVQFGANAVQGSFGGVGGMLWRCQVVG